MITNLPKEQLVLLGSNVSARRMIDQARYTLGLVSVDAPVKSALGQAFLAEAQGALESLEAALSERLVARTKAKEAGRSEDAQVKSGLRRRRSFVKRLSIARRRGAPLPLDATRMGTKSDAPGAIATDLERLLSMAKPVASNLASVGVPAEYLKLVEEEVQRLKEADRVQEMASRSQHRDAVARKRELTAVAYLAVKSIHEMGQAVHVDDPVKVAQYSLAILKRQTLPVVPSATAPPDGPPTAAA